MINKVILVGNVGLDPEVRTLETGVKVARVRLATSERIFNRQTNESTEHTEWHTVTLWRGLAEVVDKYVRKGSQIYIEGRLRSREWERDGVKHYTTEIVADDMKLLGRRPEGAPQQAAYQQPQQPAYQQTQQPTYQQPQQPAYQQTPQQPAYQSIPQPEAPFVPAEDPDDLPF
ncbi:MAG: single-stranded DNA-binding protein [Alistipes sp.]|nr:single-stranded DNA-binding protein [Alistipes sp.]